jgi:hypothetical protein
MNRKKLFPLLHSFYSFDAQVELLRHLPAVQIDLADRCRFIPALREMFSFHDSTPRSRIKAAAINKPAPIKITGHASPTAAIFTNGLSLAPCD